jgi:carbon-monoxide dehydrogenase medium subunit
MTTQHELIASDLLADKIPLLCETSLQIADPQVRYLGTLGGIPFSKCASTRSQ